jgi:hypothetical protein
MEKNPSIFDILETGCVANVVAAEFIVFVRLGPSPNPRPKAFGPKQNTKLGLHTHPPTKTFRVLPEDLGS